MNRVREMSETSRDLARTQTSVNHVASDDGVRETCRVCGKPIVQPLSSAAHKEYCCEGCVLAERKRRELSAVADETQFALADALAGGSVR